MLTIEWLEKEQKCVIDNRKEIVAKLKPIFYNDETEASMCAMLGNLAACKFYEGDVVAATLRFSTHEYQGQTFQEILATDVVKVKG